MRRLTVPLTGLGVLACVVVAVAATRQGEPSALSPIRPPGAWGPAYVAALIGAFVLYLAGLRLVSVRATGLGVVLAAAAAIQLAPLAAPLLLSTDAYSYWDYGRIAAVHGANPYRDQPSRWPHDRAYRRMGADWRHRKSVYGPVFTLAAEGDARLAEGSAHRAAFGFRLLAALGMLALTGATVAAARAKAFAAVFVGWSPLLALHFAGGGHNDVLMIFLVLAAIALAATGRLSLEGACWAGALGIKLIALVFIPLRALEAFRRRELRGVALGFVAALALLAAIASLRYGWAWLGVVSPLHGQLSQTSSLGLPYWLGRAGLPVQTVRRVLLVLFACLYLWLLREAWQGRRRLALCAVGLLVATSWLQPWYAVWAVPLAAVEEDDVARAGALVMSAYLLRDAFAL